MTRTNNNCERPSSRRSSSSLSTTTTTTTTNHSASNETKDVITQNELTIQKLLLELQDDLKKTKDCYNTSRDAWLSVQQHRSSTSSSSSSNENTASQASKNNVTQALGNVHNEMDMYQTALKKIAEVRRLQIEIANAAKSRNDADRNQTTRRGLADLLSHMAYGLKIWYGNEHHGRAANKVTID